MVPAIFRRAAREEGVWGVLAAAGTTAVVLAALALALDFTAAASAHTDVQSALDSALRSAAHDLDPASVTSAAPRLDTPIAEATADSVLGSALPGQITYRWSNPPSVQTGPPASIAATLAVTVPMPALLGPVTFPIRAEEAIGWLPH